MTYVYEDRDLTFTADVIFTSHKGIYFANIDMRHGKLMPKKGADGSSLYLFDVAKRGAYLVKPFRITESRRVLSGNLDFEALERYRKTGKATATNYCPGEKNPLHKQEDVASNSVNEPEAPIEAPSKDDDEAFCSLFRATDFKDIDLPIDSWKTVGKLS